MKNRFSLLVCDYDGTLTIGETAGQQIIEALTSISEAGKKLVLATGRELPDIRRVLPGIGLFQWVVAENGAILFEPATGAKEILGTRPPESLFNELRKQGIGPVARGEVIAAVSSRYAAKLNEIIRGSGLPYHVIMNKNSAMILPAGVDKGTGVEEALKKIGVAPSEVVAVGDGENDEDLFRVAGFRVAVANAVPELKDIADLITAGENGSGIIELVDALLEPSPIFTDSNAD
jgi:phosphoglycolate phosphatase (TIGR01487 family)